ncbi:MAG: beta-ketoacyl-[acyl-carrier-protein] synthase family protein [Candidatus Methanomethyliaceae archaeon]
MKPRRVVITGIGVIAPNGIGKEAFWDALVNGRSGIKKITLFEPKGLPSDVAGEVTEFDPAMFVPCRYVEQRGRATHLGVAAARMALEDSSVPPGTPIDMMVGMTFPAMDYVEELVKQFSTTGAYRKEDLFRLYTSVSPNMVAMDIAAVCGIEGLRFTISNACSSGALAIIEAFYRIRQGKSKICLAGGVDACLSYLSFAALIASGFHVVSDLPPEKQSRPYDRLRTVGVVSEGAGFMVIESLDHATARNASIYGEILGVAVSTSPPSCDPAVLRSGLAHCIKESLENAHVQLGAIDYICSHGPSLQVFDYIETLAFKDVFGSFAYCIPISSIKSMIGNPMAASGPLQVAAALLAAKHSLIPPTINLDFPDPLCDLDYVPHHPRANRIDIALVDSHGFDNVDASIVLGSGGAR